MLIKEMIELTNSNKLVLPNFQRTFEWNRKSQKTLLASIFTNIPIGSVLLLKGAKNDFASRKMCISKSNLEQAELRDELIYLLDGQQRMSSIKSFFYDLYQGNSDDQGVFNALKTRWFYKFDNESDFLGFHNLSFDEGSESITHSTPQEIINHLIEKQDIIGNPFYGLKKGGLKSDNALQYYIKEKLFPLQILSTEKTLITKLLRQIAKSKIEDLLRKLVSDDEANIAIDNIRSIFSDERDIDKYLEQYIENHTHLEGQELEELFADKANNWVVNVKTFLQSLLDQKVNNITLESDQIPKASVIFEYINQGGTPLSTFDLLVAKNSKLNLQEYLTQELTTPKNWHEFDNWSPTEFNVFDGDELEKKFKDQFVNLLSLLAYENHKGFKEFKVDHVKRDLILKLNEDDIAPVLDDTIRGLIRSYYFFQKEARLHNIKNIPYELMILPIGYVLSKKDKKYEDVFPYLKYFYWLMIFSGRYSKEQNIRSIQDVITLKSWCFDRISPNIWDIDSERFSQILNLEDFVNEDIIFNNSLENHTPQVIKTSLMNYILKGNPSDLKLTERGNSKGGVDYDLSDDNIRSNNIQIDYHHIIPLTEGKKFIKQSTEEIRKNKTHLLNSVINLTPITNKANLYISSISPSEYLSLIKNSSEVPLVNHYIPMKGYKNLDFSNIDIQKQFLQERFGLLKSAIINELNNTWKEIEMT